MFPVVMPTYARADLAFERGEGCWLTTTDGRRFLDFGSGVAVTSLGHCHPRLVAALTEQAGKLWHCSNLYRIPGQERAARQLVEHSFADTVFFTNSGAESMECCLKMARKFQHSVGAPQRWRTIVALGAFHGRTLATIAAGGQEKHLKGFEPMVEGFDRVLFGDLAAAEAAIGPHTAAILVEPIQGEGGVTCAPAGYLAGLRQLADRHGLLLMFDEVQCGMGRTGKLFAHEWAGITPDVLGTAKGLGGGFPIGACLATERAAQGMTAGAHGSTFGGNPLATAAANAVLDVMLEPGFLEGVRTVAERLSRGLEGLVQSHPEVFLEVRGQGLMRGLKAKPVNTDVVARGIARGLLTIPAGDNVVRVLPPLVVSEAEIDQGLALLGQVARDLAG